MMCYSLFHHQATNHVSSQSSFWVRVTAGKGPRKQNQGCRKDNMSHAHIMAIKKNFWTWSVTPEWWPQEELQAGSQEPPGRNFIFVKSQDFQGAAQQIRHRCLPTTMERQELLSTPQCQAAGALPTCCCHSQKCFPWKRIPPGMSMKGLEMLICWHNDSQEISCQRGRKNYNKKNHRNVCLIFHLNPKYTLGFVLIFYLWTRSSTSGYSKLPLVLATPMHKNLFHVVVTFLSLCLVKQTATGIKNVHIFFFPPFLPVLK